MRTYSHLSEQERRFVYRGLQQELKPPEIARALRRHPTTIRR
ncbi:MAG: helix-turn-helix domain-containing protein, partial [bacterium]